MAQTSRAKKAAMSGGEDRISALPDGVLEHVLGFLRADEAVQTSVLARRWRHLWRSMRRLLIIDKATWTSVSFKKFMNGLLLLRDTGVPLDEVQFSIMDDYGTYISIWIRHFLFCQAKVLAIYFNAYDLHLALDGHLFSQHLQRLELHYVHLKESSLDFARCPALEVLKITSSTLGTDRISFQSVKHLSIQDCDCDFSPKGMHIAAPGLVWLQLYNCNGKVPLLQKMPSLETAILSISPSDYCDTVAYGKSCGVCLNCCSDNDHNTGDLLGCLSSATNLELTTVPGTLILGRCCPTFSRLKTLLLNVPGKTNDLHSLVCILEHSPVLSKLTLQLSKGYTWTGELEGNYNPVDQLPAISEFLDTVEIQCRKVDERVCYLLKFLGRFVKNINIKLDGKPSTRMQG